LRISQLFGFKTSQVLGLSGKVRAPAFWLASGVTNIEAMLSLLEDMVPSINSVLSHHPKQKRIQIRIESFWTLRATKKLPIHSECVNLGCGHTCFHHFSIFAIFHPKNISRLHTKNFPPPPKFFLFKPSKCFSLSFTLGEWRVVSGGPRVGTHTCKTSSNPLFGFSSVGKSIHLRRMPEETRPP